MPIDQRRRDEIAAAVAAYDSANPRRVCRAAPRGSWPPCSRLRTCANAAWRTLLRKASTERALPANLRRLVEAGFLSRTPGSGSVPDTYRLHLPPVRR